MCVIRVDNLKKSFGTIQAVDGVSFEVRRAEAFGLLGPNGAGKTTTLKMLVGVLNPDSGTVWIHDGNPTSPHVRASIGIVPQGISFWSAWP
jgi:ABC-type multidrug transport system ATPase subunit